MNRLALLLLAAPLFVSCASSVRLHPDLSEGPRVEVPLDIRGTLSFFGGREFLPPALAALPTEGQLQPVFVYEYYDRYRETTIPEVLALYNPLSLVGFPTGTDAIRVAGHLEIRVAGEVVRTYTATGMIENTRNVLTGSPLAELRRRSLVAVRDNIQQQLINDADAIAVIVRSAVEPAKGSDK